MNRPRLLKILKIALSAVCGIACVLLISLWVRSYWWQESVSCDGQARLINIETNFGLVRVGVTAEPSPFGDNDGTWSFDRFRAAPENVRSFDWNGVYLTLPYWFILALTASLAAIPWIRWRFSLRTLLIATTLVAVVLGLIVWLP
jgi:hypothetical protein